MRGLSCMRTAELLDRRAQGLSNADALRLEEHLSRCEQCGQDFALLEGLRGLSAELPQALPRARRERAIEAALSLGLAQGGARGAAAAPAAMLGRRPALALGGAALAAAAALALGLLRPWASEPGEVEATLAAHDGDRVLQGALEIDGRPHAHGDALPARARLHAARPATVALAHGRLELAAGTTLRWDRDARQVALEQGSVTADVDPSARQRFSVATSRFTVRVLGTRFTVRQDGVTVERGKVAVLAPDGALLVAALSAGQSYTAATPSTAASAPAAPQPAADSATMPSSADVDAEATAASGEAEQTGEGRHTERTGARARGLLARARAELASGDAGSARGTVDDALALSLSRADRAEALSLRAECALVAGDLGRAIAGYLRVSRSYGSLPAGQNALFAAARLQAERGQRAQAVALLRRYLERHPRGRFVNEARERLAELDAERRP